MESLCSLESDVFEERTKIELHYKKISEDRGEQKHI